MSEDLSQLKAKIQELESQLAIHTNNFDNLNVKLGSKLTKQNLKESVIEVKDLIVGPKIKSENGYLKCTSSMIPSDVDVDALVTKGYVKNFVPDTEIINDTNALTIFNVPNKNNQSVYIKGLNNNIGNEIILPYLSESKVGSITTIVNDSGVSAAVYVDQDGNNTYGTITNGTNTYNSITKYTLNGNNILTVMYVAQGVFRILHEA